MRISVSLAVVVLLFAFMIVAPAQTNGPLASFSFNDGNGTGRFGSGLMFSGGADGRSLPVAGLSNAFTFETWINPSAFAWSDVWTQRPDTPGSPIYTLCTTPSGAIYFAAYQGDSSYPIFTGPTLPLNVWTHVAVTYDGSQIRIYFNAIEVGRRPAYGSLLETSQPMEVGAEFQGRLDEIRIYNRALGAAEIALDLATPIDPLEAFQVSVVTPLDQALGVSATPVTATFSAGANPATVTSSTFELRDATDALVPASVSYDAVTRTATLAPASPLAAMASYSARVRGDSSGVAAVAGATLHADTVWTFRTAAAPSAPRVSLAFEEGTGSEVADASGHGNRGLLKGAVWAAGMYGSGVQFDGVYDDVQVPASDSTAITSAFTFEAWVKPTAYAWGDIWSQYPDDGGNFLYDFAITDTGSLYTAPHLGGNDYPLFTMVTMALDVWTHVALTYDGAKLRIYVEGLEVASRTAHGLLEATPEPMEIGQWFHGSIDEVRVYNRALTAGEITVDRQTPVAAEAPFVVTVVTPKNGAVGVIGTQITAVFSAAVDPTTLTADTFTLRDAGGAPVAASVLYDPSTRMATLAPASALAALADYTVRVSSAVASAGGIALAGDVTWPFRTAPPSSLPSAAYAFSEADGATTDDWSGNGNLASLVRGAAWGSGFAGGGVLMPGGYSDLVVPSSDSIILTDGFTFETWVNPSSPGMLWGRRPDDTGENPLYELWTLPSVYFNARLGNTDFPLMTTATLPLNVWSHVAVTFDGSWLRIFLNGVEAASRTASGSLGTTNEPMEIGRWFAGSLDEIRTYRRALSAEEIATDMAMPVDPRQSVIASIAPASGSAAQVVTIAGVNFGATQGSSVITFNGVAAAVSGWSATSITAVVPAGALSGPVVVMKQGVASNGVAFTVIPRPVISGLSPASGVVGQAITIAGTDFGSVQGQAIVAFNGVAAIVSSWSDTAIVVIVPVGATTGPVVVTANGFASNAVAFIVVTPPVISAIGPASGPAGQAVTITGANFGALQGSSVVTFNGATAAISTWSASSITASVPAAATTGPVVVTVSGYASNGITFTVNGPRISASVSPPPNSLGWNNSSVTVTFTCTATDSPISSCTSPKTTSSSGAAIKVTGQAVDQNGVIATMVVLLNIDLTGPAIDVYVPATNVVFPLGTASVGIKGSAVDILSGASFVTCAGVPAVVVGQNFSCPVTVVDGPNQVPIVAFDVAGRSTTKNLSLLVADVPPASLAISPATLTMSAGTGQVLAVTDDRGRAVAGGSWSSSDANVAVVVDTGVPEVHALGTGTATLTLTRNGLSAHTTVTVLAADATVPDGTTLWSLAASPNSQSGTPGLREIVRAVPVAQVSLFFVERGPYFQNQDTTVRPTVIRAVAVDGRELWTYTLPADPVFGGYMPVKQVAADDRGGIVIVVSSSRPVCCYEMNEAIRRIDGATGQVSWEFQHREAFGRFSEVAIHPDGTVYVVEKLSNANSTDLVALDGLTGRERYRVDLTAGHSTYPNGSNATGPVVQDDGSVAVVVSRWDNVTLSQAPRSAWRATLNTAIPALSLEPLTHGDGSAVNLGVGDIMSGPWPDGAGGLTVGNVSSSSTSGFANLVHVGVNLVASPTIDLPFGTAAARDLQYILSDNAAYVLVQYWEGSATTGARAYKVDPASLSFLDVFDLSGGPYVQFTSAIAGGGTLYTSHVLNDTVQIGYGALAGWLSAAPIAQKAATTTDAETKWPYRRGVTSHRDASNPRLGIFVKAQFVVAPFFHTSIRVVPKNQDRWAWTPGFHQDTFGAWFLTIGAESDTNDCGGLLKSDLNRPSDVDPNILIYRERLSYSSNDEETIVTGLLKSDGNYSDDLFYTCFPLQAYDKYNSNSYTHGLINEVGLPSPVTPYLVPYFHPGWTKPVPPVEFNGNP